MGILSNFTRVSTTVYQLYTNERLEEKAKWELHKGAACCFEQILEAAPYQNGSCTVSYLLSQTIQQDMQGTAREVAFYIWTHLC